MFKRSQTQILYRYLPGAVFEHDRYGICRVTDVAVTAPDNINEGALQNAIANLLNVHIGAENFPDPYNEWQDYMIGLPDRVNFEPFPPIVECSNCGHVTSLTQLARLPFGTEPVCQECHLGKYRQLPYVTIHNCGNLVEIPVPSCPTHGREHMYFVDTGRFVTAEWRCSQCSYTRGMPRYTCNCLYSRHVLQSLDDGEAIGNRNNMIYARTNDTSVFYSHTLSIVNLAESDFKRLREDERANGLLLARLWSLIDDNIFELAQKRAAARLTESSSTDELEILKSLLAEHPDDLRIQQLLESHATQIGLPRDKEIEQVETDVPGSSTAQPSQALLEHVSILDSLNIIGPKEVINNAHQRGDVTGRLDFELGLQFAQDRLGILSISCITDFPIALASPGYSRVSKSPGAAVLNPYHSERYGGRVPIYVVTSNTEAIMVQLDPQRVVRWLLANGFAEGTYPSTEYASWVWIKQHMPNLSTFQGILYEQEHLNRAESATLTLIHTVSHVLMKEINWSGFDPESVGEYLLPEALSLVIHSNNYTSFTIGGMVTMYEQRLHGWLREAYNAAFNCIYNPICEDEGASCSGCVHRQYNCEAFNHFLSRSVLKGGYSFYPRGAVDVGYWTLGPDA